MNYLITGGVGFVGTSLVPVLVKKEDVEDIFILDKISYKSNSEILSQFTPRGKLRLIQGDIRNKKLVESLVSKVDVIIHLAAETHVDHSIKTPGKFQDVNVRGTLTLLEATNTYPIKLFLHVSTDEVWGQIAPPNRFCETDIYQPRNPYSASKASADHFVLAWLNTYNLNYKIVHFTNLYGAYQHMGKFIPKTIVCALHGLPITIHGNGQQVRSWLHIEDAISGLLNVLDNGKFGSSYIVGSEEGHSILQITKLILETLEIKNTSLIKHVPDRSGQDMRYAVTCERIRNELGWTPNYNIINGLATVVKWYQEHCDWWKSRCKTLHFKRSMAFKGD